MLSIPTQSGKAAFSLKNLLVFLKVYSHAGIVAGVFFGYGRRSAIGRARRGTSVIADARQ